MIEEYLNSSLVRTYTYGAYIDDPLMVEYGGQRYFYLKDRRYSVTALTDAAGSIVETYEYSAFGRMTIYDAAGQDITASGSTIGNPYGFTGRRFDAETGLWYYRNRMYSPVLGRFLQRDPAGYVDGMNLYAYVQNNPIKYLDPEGLMVRWASDKIETGITEASSYLETGLNIFSDYMTEHSAEIEQEVQGVVENSGIENLQATLNTMALTYGVSESILWGGANYLGGEALILSAKSASIAGGVVGGTDFLTEIARGASTKEASISALISGLTTLVAVNSAALGSGLRLAGASGTTANAFLNYYIREDVNIVKSIASGYSMTFGEVCHSFALSQKYISKSLPSLYDGLYSGFLGTAKNELVKLIPDRQGANE